MLSFFLFFATITPSFTANQAPHQQQEAQHMNAQSQSKKISRQQILSVLKNREETNDFTFATMESPIGVLEQFYSDMNDGQSIDLLSQDTSTGKELTEAQKKKIRFIHEHYKVFLYLDSGDSMDMSMFNEHDEVITLESMTHEDTYYLTDVLLALDANFKLTFEDIDDLANKVLLCPELSHAKKPLLKAYVSEEQLKFSAVSGANVSQAMQKVIKHASERTKEKSESLEQLSEINAVLELAKKEPISITDYIWTQHASLLATILQPDAYQDGDAENIMHLASSLMTYIEKNGLGDNPLTDEGQLKIHAYRFAANHAAWLNRKTNTAAAIDMMEKTLPYITDKQRYMIDTYVRALLIKGDKERAYPIVRQQLAEHPWFDDFEDFYDNNDYLSWSKRQKALNPLANTDDYVSGKTVLEEQKIAVHAASQKIAVYWHNTLQMFDLQSGKRLWQVDTGTSSPFAFRFSLDGEQLVSSGWNTVSVWHTPSGKQITRLQHEEGNAKCAAFSADGNTLAHQKEEDLNISMVFYAIDQQTILATMPSDGDGCNVSADGQFISTGYRVNHDNQIDIAHVKSAQKVATLTGDAANAYDDDVFFVENNQSFLVRDYSDFHLWSIDKQKVKTTWETDGMDVDHVAVGHRFMLALDGDEKTIASWHFDQPPQKPQSLALPNVALSKIHHIFDIQLSANEKQYAIVAQNRTNTLSSVYVFDTKTHQLIHDFVTDKPATSAHFFDDGAKLVLNGYPIQIVDLAKKKVLIELDNRQH